MKQTDFVIAGIDRALRVVSGVARASRAAPGGQIQGQKALEETERRHSAGLMRVNHVGEVCAQALYEAQGHFARTPELKQQFEQAGKDEEDHLAWTAERLAELGSRPSLLNPIWYAGAFVMGVIAAKAGDRHSLGFVVETERQVEAHLANHLKTLPEDDLKSRAIVDQMRLDEVEHGAAAQALGAEITPAPIRAAMTAVAMVMTTTAYYI